MTAKIHHTRRGSLPAQFEAGPCRTPAGAGHPVKAMKDAATHLPGSSGGQPANARGRWSADGHGAMRRTPSTTNDSRGHATPVSFYACRAAGPAFTRDFSDLTRDTQLTSDTSAPATGLCLGRDVRAFDNNYGKLSLSGYRPGRVACRRACMEATGRI